MLSLALILPVYALVFGYGWLDDSLWRSDVSLNVVRAAEHFFYWIVLVIPPTVIGLNLLARRNRVFNRASRAYHVAITLAGIASFWSFLAAGLALN